MSEPLVLGISAFYHDAAAALVRGGEIVAAAQEERFSRKKHDPRFPRHAINYCLEEAFIEPRELGAVVFYDNPVATFDRVVKNALAVAPAGQSEDQWAAACRSLLGVKARVKDHVRAVLGDALPPLLCTDHHLAHAASAYYPSPFDHAAILVVDGVGEWATCSVGVGEGARIELEREIRYPHSLGLLYSAFTSFCGFKVNSGEYKLMGLAPYGRPIYADRIRQHLIDVKEDGSFRLDTAYFGYLDSGVMTNPRFEALFDGPPRAPESRITRREIDLAASIQLVLEEVMMKLARHAKSSTGARNLVLAGGVALNCVANGKIQREAGFDGVWIQPAAGDAGGALGAALLTSHAHFGAPRPSRADGHATPRDRQRGSYLGPRLGVAEMRSFLDRRALSYRHVPDADARATAIATALAAGKVVGYFEGRMEFGPRALGARSILGDPRRAETQSVMNIKIKFRESFRPFAPSVLAERAGDYFEMEGESPYMLLCFQVRPERRLPLGDIAGEDLLPIVNQARSDIPAVTHVDYSARVQTVAAEDAPGYHRLIAAFERLTGCGVIVNTSFNVRGEPIVGSPLDAYRCFMRTEMDLLVLEEFLLDKSAQPPLDDREDWKATYELD